MAIDRQRYKKTYPLRRVKPRFEEASVENGGNPNIVYLETMVIEFNDSDLESKSASQEYTNPVILTSATANVNVYVNAVYTMNGVTVIEVASSASITGDVYVAIGEATNPPQQQFVQQEVQS